MSSFITLYNSRSVATNGQTDSVVFAVSDTAPYRRLITTSVTHVGFLQAIGADSCIAGVCDANYLYTPVPWAEDIGSSLSLDVERVLAAQADLVLLTYSGDSRGEVVDQSLNCGVCAVGKLSPSGNAVADLEFVGVLLNADFSGKKYIGCLPFIGELELELNC